MKRIQRSVGFKLFASIFVSMAAVFLAVSAWSEHRSEQAWRQSFDQHARQTSAVLERALRYGMLLKKKKGVHSELKTLAAQPGVKAIRIFDKKGRVAFSSLSGDKGKKLDKKDPLCSLCHAQQTSFRPPSREPFSRTFRDENGRLVMSHIHLIENSAECSNGPCHAHPPKQKVLGVLDLQMDMNVVDTGRVSAQRTTAYATLLMALVGGIVTAAFVWAFVRRPVQRLVAGTERVANAGLDTRIPVKGTGEFAELAKAFNRMTADLEIAQERTARWESELEAAVQQKTEELGRAHGKLMQMEKMASLGKLAATVAHELNNPLAGILVYSKLVARELKDDDISDEDRTEALRCVEVIQHESTRCGDIVKNLLTFARQSKAEFALTSLTSVIERSVQTVEHLIKHASVDFTLTRLSVSDEVLCDGNQYPAGLRGTAGQRRGSHALGRRAEPHPSRLQRRSGDCAPRHRRRHPTRCSAACFRALCVHQGREGRRLGTRRRIRDRTAPRGTDRRRVRNRQRHYVPYRAAPSRPGTCGSFRRMR